MNIAIGIGIFIGFAFVVAWLVYWISRAKGTVIDSPEDLQEKMPHEEAKKLWEESERNGNSGLYRNFVHDKLLPPIGKESLFNLKSGTIFRTHLFYSDEEHSDLTPIEKPKSSCCSADTSTHKNNTQTVLRCVKCGKICKTK